MMRVTESSGDRWTKRRRRHDNMIVIVTLISTTFLFVIALATRFRRKRPFTAETVIQDGLASFGVGIAFGLVAYPTLSVVAAFVRNNSTFTPSRRAGSDAQARAVFTLGANHDGDIAVQREQQAKQALQRIAAEASTQQGRDLRLIQAQ